MKKLLYVVLVAAMLLAGCAAPTAAPAPVNTQAAAAPAATSAPAAAGGAVDGKGMLVGLSMDSLESAFWVANEKAIKDQAVKDNVKLVEVIAEGDANKQNQQIENLIAQGVKAIIIAPKDGSAIEAAVQKAHDAGIPVIMDNRPVQGDIAPDMQILSDNTTMAEQALQWFVDRAKTEGKTYKALLLIGALSDQNAIERKTGHMKVLDANKDVINVVAQVPSEWKQDVALQGIQNAFQANPDINLIITPSDFLLPPIQSALQQINRWKKIGEDGHVALVTFDGDENGMSALINGYSEVDAAQGADTTGWAAVDWAVKLANGEKPTQVNLLDPGKIATLDNKDTVWPTIWGFAGAGGTAAAAPTAAPSTEVVDGKGMLVGLSMDSLESAFWVANEKAIKDQAVKDNVKLVEVIAEGDANKQNQQIENLIAQGVKAIIIAPKDGSAIEAAVQKAHDAGIPVIMDNRPVQGDIAPDMQILSDNTTMAEQALQWFVDRAKTEGKTYKALLLIGALSDQNAIERKTGHMKVLDANKDVINVVAQVPSEWKQDVALQGIQNAFQANPDINLIITPSDFLLPPIQSALQQINRWKKIGEDGHVALVTFDGDENGMSALINGYSEVDAAQGADTTGWAAVDWAVKLANGEKPTQVNLLDPGKIATLDNKDTVWPTIWGFAGAK